MRNHHAIRPPSPAMGVALLALFIALGGASYAAVSVVPDNSVGTPQLKNDAVTSPKIASGAVTKPKLNLAGVTAPNASELGGHPASAYAGSAQPGFTTVTMGGGIAIAPVGYMKDTLGFVHLKGIVSCDTGTTSLFTLPAGDRPSQFLLMPGAVASSGNGPAVAYGYVSVGTDGSVAVENGDTVPAECGLDGLSFYAGG